jgi:hypothetical protein
LISLDLATHPYTQALANENRENMLRLPKDVTVHAHCILEYHFVTLSVCAAKSIEFGGTGGQREDHFVILSRASTGDSKVNRITDRTITAATAT